MRMISVVLTLLVACFVVVKTSVAADDAAAKEKPAKSKWVQAMEKTFKTKDKDEDGFLSFDEFKGRTKKPEAVEKAEQRFKRIDKDGDKKLTLEEFKAAQKKRQPKKPATKKFQPKLLKSAEKK